VRLCDGANAPDRGQKGEQKQQKVIDMENKEINNQDVAEPDQIASGAAGTGQQNEELKWMKRLERKASAQAEGTAGRQENKAGAHSAEPRAPRLVERVTALRGQAIDHGQRPKRSVRSGIRQELLAYDSDIPYMAAEKAQRDLVCSLIERQDRVTEKLLLMINDLQYRTDELELTVEAVLRRKTGIPSSPDRAGAGGPANSTTGREQP
jgi:hypothetical protein